MGKRWVSPKEWRYRTYKRFEAALLILFVSILVLGEFNDVPFNVRFAITSLGFVLGVVAMLTISLPWYIERIRRHDNTGDYGKDC